MNKLLSLGLYGTTDASGNATIDAPIAIRGSLHAVQWVDGTLDDGVGGTLSVQNASGQSVAFTLLTLSAANSDALYYPRHVVHGETGSALTGTSGGDRAMPLIDGVLRLAIASGGDTKTGGCIVYYYDRG